MIPAGRPWQIGMKSIGVLGGMGPQATMDFEARVHAVAQSLIPSRRSGGYPPMVVYYYRHPPFLLEDEETPAKPLQPDPRLLLAVRQLAQLTDFLVITANAPHLVRESLEAAFPGGVLSIVDVTLAELSRHKLDRVGLIGLGDPQVYLRPLAASGVVTVTVPQPLRARLDRAIFAVMEGREDEADRDAARSAVQFMRNEGVQAILLGCTELPLLLGPAAAAADGIINPSQLLAEAAVRFAISEVAALNRQNSTGPTALGTNPQPARAAK